ncbi:hypothetical protein [Achromobacter xylosoxidans]|uniref:hypothetical protein n=1 Tax=Alcaligenes xylosoxydans xylosoxydans TaxID=85698 RepID=UPI0006C6682D|nr:hypothetical protein [Achromobacter xylosoxidans]QQE57435.1 hypothetical protein I6H41_31975 [Achromobacter xylosoxidans]QQV17074.1 hypothetical protein I6I48_14915 [Achromobacter xylosoxidans]CUI48617.1 Uncharacterised protein [Achromobacter xylosoxidans]
MNGIDFMVRDRGGWLPPVPLPRRRLRWTDPKAEAIKPEEIEFIRAARGRLSTYELGDCYGVSPQTISNIWAGRCSAGLSPRPARPRAKRKQK